MKGNRRKHLPSFKSVDELVVFFETHDIGEYWEALPEADVEISLRKRVSAGNSKERSINGRSKSSRNTRTRWTPMQVKQLRQLASQNTPIQVIGLKLGRTENAVRTKASEKGVSLKSKNQASYYRRKK